jgi:beta-aspartyl-dipeptidase (metallo-type)
MVTVINNVRLAGSDKTADILIAGGKIIEIGGRREYSLQDQYHIDANGMVAVPGYLDQHVHITGGGGEGGFSNRVPELNPIDCIRGGVTSLVGLLGTDAQTRSIEDLLAKTKSLREFGLTAFCLTGAYQYPAPTLTGSVEKDIVFIDEIIGVKTALSDHRSSCLSKEDLIHLATQARRGGILANKPGVVHMHMGSGKNGLGLVFDVLKSSDLPIYNFRPTHVQRVFDDAVKFANLGGYIDFTAGGNPLETAEFLTRALGLVPPELVTLSSDSNGSMPVWNEKKEMIGLSIGRITSLHRVIKSLIFDCGLSVADAVRPVTESVAKALCLYPRKGAIRAGSDADLLLLDQNCDIDTVLAAGVPMMQGGLIKKEGPFKPSI